MIRIILAEDHHIVRNGIRNLLEKESDLEIVAEASNGTEVLNLIMKGTNADIILADMNMPLLGGIEMTEQLLLQNRPVKVLLLTMLDHEHYVIKAFKSGVQGFLLKNISTDELLFAIRHVHVNGNYICSELSLRMLNKLSRLPTARSKVELTTEESELLNLISEGMTNQEIADLLLTSKRAIEGQRKALIGKAQVRNTAALIRYSVQNKLIC